MMKIFFSASPSSSSSNSTSVAVWCERGCGGVPAIWGGATRAAGGEPQQVVVVRGQAVRSAAGAARLAELPLARVGVEGVRVVEALALAEAAEVEDLVAVGQQRRLHPTAKGRAGHGARCRRALTRWWPGPAWWLEPMQHA
jgi:hypothetical protein